MATFHLSDLITIECRAENTRSGFRHLATLLIDGREADKAKVCYLNRTWERYTYETVLYVLAEKAKSLLPAERLQLIDSIKTKFWA